MSGNTSGTGGYVRTSTAAVSEDSLTNIFQSLVVSITGLDPTLVRPRWQPQPPTQPPVTADWCGIGVTSYSSFDYPQEVHDGTGLGSSDLARLERINLLASFYGPNSSSNASALRDGVYLNQNFQILSAQGVKLRSADDITHVPELINKQFVSRSDVPMSFMRMVQRTYPIKNIASAVVTVTADNGDGCVEIIQEA